MKEIAKIEDGIVTQVIVCDSAEWAQNKLGGTWLSCDTCRVGIGFTFTEKEGFRPPKPHEMAYWDLTEGQWIIPDEYLPEDPQT